MRRWSRFSYFFRKDDGGAILYNSFSGVLSSLDDMTASLVEQLAGDPGSQAVDGYPALLAQLIAMKCLLVDEEDEDLLNHMRMSRHAVNYSSRRLLLSIAPTLACNFRCDYCFEAGRGSDSMSVATAEALMKFVQRLGRFDRISVTWLGGEPLLVPERIISLTEHLKSLGAVYSASLVTNGYLLDEGIISLLSGLSIKAVQVTLDGPEAWHDARRHLVNGGGTWRTIVTNLSHLLANWNGQCAIRVNVDRNNQSQFREIVRILQKELPGKRYRIYPTMLLPGGANPDRDCQLDPECTADFLLNEAARGGADLNFNPERRHVSCTATARTGFVIGPGGELYKCWEDLGDPSRVLGNVTGDRPWNHRLEACYLEGVDPFDDPACRQCVCLPRCNGGCARIRLKRAEGVITADPCVPYKHRLREFLEIHSLRKAGA
jgi:uncharacterized protein